MKRLARTLYFWVVLGALAGGLLGLFVPDTAVALKPLGDVFIRLIKMLIAPLIFCTVALGIAHLRSVRAAGRVGLKALVYFELLTTLALVIGLVVVNVTQPGAGLHADLASLESVTGPTTDNGPNRSRDPLWGLVPSTLLFPLVSGDLLQVLLTAVFCGAALAGAGERGGALVRGLESAASVLFRIMHGVMWLAPLGVAGALAFAVGEFGLQSLGALARLMLAFYVTCALFIFGVLGLVCAGAGFSLVALLRYLRAELITVFGTSSSETVLAPLMERLERLGCRRTTVGLVVPTGYSFNLDGICIYLTMATVFLAQALDVSMSYGEQASLVLIAMLTSKGAAGVTGSGFVTLTATLSAMPVVPVAAASLILGIDRFMSEARSITNLIGNAVAALVVSRWEGEVSGADLRHALRALTVAGAASADGAATSAPSPR